MLSNNTYINLVTRLLIDSSHGMVYTRDVIVVALSHLAGRTGSESDVGLGK